MPTYVSSLASNTYTLKYNTKATLIKTVFNQESISNNIQTLKTNNSKFTDYTTSKSSAMMSYFISNVVLVSVLTIIGLVGYFLKKEKFLLITSILIYSFIVPAFVVLGLNIGYFLMNIDYCAEVNKYTTSSFYPVNGKGIGYYTSCVSKENQVNLSTARYQISYSYNIAYDDINTYISTNLPTADHLPTNKRDNTALNAYKNTYSSVADISSGVDLLIAYNNILEVVEPTFSCTKVDNIITYAENTVCYKNITEEFELLKFFFVGIFFLIPLAIGINKLIVVVDPLFDKKTVS